MTSNETITVEKLGKFGPLVNGVFYGYSKKLDASVQGKFVPGGVYDVEIYTAESGKKYINKLNSVSGAKTAVGVIMSEVKAPIKAVAKVSKSEEMTRSDWDAKDRRISRQGVIQVAVQVESNFDAATELADKMLEYVNRKGA